MPISLSAPYVPNKTALFVVVLGSMLFAYNHVADAKDMAYDPTATPREVYETYKNAVGEVASMDQLFPYLSNERIDNIDRSVQRIVTQGETRKEALESTLRVLRRMEGYAARKFQSEQINGPKATLVYESVDTAPEMAGYPKMCGEDCPCAETVTMVYENGWKIGAVETQSNSKTTTQVKLDGSRAVSTTCNIDVH